jgi:hypothetical protein
MKAPTQFASFGLALSPVNSIHAAVGYSISSVSGSRFFNRANDVLGSLDSAYQSPYVNLAWTVHPGWVWKADYNYYGYGEGDTGQATGQLSCSTQVPLLTTAATTARCSTLLPSGAYNFTAPRNFHASLLTLSMHYEF